MVHKTADAIIIGSGTLGTAVSYYLSKAGLGEVIVIERNTIGSGSTSWAASLVNRIRTKTEQIPLVMETCRVIDNLESELNESLGYKRVGCLHLAASDQTHKSLQEIVRLSKVHLVEGEFVSRKDVGRRLPWINPDRVSSAYFMPGDFYLDAYILANAFARAAKFHGTVFMQNTGVSSILAGKGKVTGVKLHDNSVISSPLVINAGGAWANLLSYETGVSLPMAPVRSIYWLTKADSGKFPEDMPITFIPDAMVYTRPEAGSLLFGIRDRESKNFDPRKLPFDYTGYSFISDEAQWNILIEEGKRFKRFFPELYDTPIAHCISGLSTYTVDGRPVIGPCSALEGYYAATGCNGAGLSLAGGYGRLLKEFIFGEDTFVDHKSFLPDRLGLFDPFTEDFGQRCSATRSSKRHGG